MGRRYSEQGYWLPETGFTGPMGHASYIAHIPRLFLVISKVVFGKWTWEVVKWNEEMTWKT